MGAVVGVVITSYLADRFGPRIITFFSFASSGLALLIMSTGVVPLIGMYALVAVVGFGSIGAQILLNGFVATYYDNETRASALGLTLGIGRIGAVLAISLGGVLVAAGYSTFINFAVWSLPAIVGMIAVSLVPRRKGVVGRQPLDLSHH
ncbi:MFS transporter [Corynebacterium callunae]|uniref:MFS transporter n=1 Tax=Corynebacterium callunae TaxID=1721 RepID=UPI0024A85143|nr:MFS transporter [Corynebacterium callunae]